jgi:hypothetical protein
MTSREVFAKLLIIDRLKLGYEMQAYLERRVFLTLQFSLSSAYYRYNFHIFSKFILRVLI